MLKKICSLLNRCIYKIKREVWYMFHPYLWGTYIQVNGIPVIQAPDKLVLGRDVSINNNVFLQCAGGVNIESNVTLSYGVTVLTQGLDVSDYFNNAGKQLRNHCCDSVFIGKGTWIAANVTILPGDTYLPIA